MVFVSETSPFNHMKDHKPSIGRKVQLCKTFLVYSQRWLILFIYINLCIYDIETGTQVEDQSHSAIDYIVRIKVLCTVSLYMRDVRIMTPH